MPDPAGCTNSPVNCRHCLSSLRWRDTRLQRDAPPAALTCSPRLPAAPVQAERLAHERAEEDEFRRRTLERFAEEDRLEQMNAQKRRLKVAEHVREVNRLVAEKRAMYEAARVSRGASWCSTAFVTVLG